MSGIIKIPTTGVYVVSPYEDLNKHLAINSYPSNKYLLVNGYLYQLTKLAAPQKTFISFND